MFYILIFSPEFSLFFHILIKEYRRTRRISEEMLKILS